MNDEKDDSLNPTTQSADSSAEELRLQEESKIASILAYVPFLCFYPLLVKRDDPVAYHHGKQGTFLFAVELFAIAMRWDFVWNFILILCGAIAIWGMVSALRGDSFRIPVISDLLDKYKP
jgi:uncharacterized membrane protein